MTDELFLVKLLEWRIEPKKFCEHRAIGGQELLTRISIKQLHSIQKLLHWHGLWGSCQGQQTERRDSHTFG
jgi:hypothetical protein